jgi:hypothetical protein
VSRRYVTVEDVYAPGREPGGYLRQVPLITVNEDALAAAAAEPALATECARCRVPLDPEWVRRHPTKRFCTVTCQTAAWRRRDRLRARSQPPVRPTPEQHAQIQAEMRRAYALARYHLTGVAPDADAPTGHDDGPAEAGEAVIEKEHDRGMTPDPPTEGTSMTDNGTDIPRPDDTTERQRASRAAEAARSFEAAKSLSGSAGDEAMREHFDRFVPRLGPVVRPPREDQA